MVGYFGLDVVRAPELGRQEPHHPALAVIFAYPSHLAPSAKFDFSNIDRISPPLIALP